jgi:hypothetical protein
VNARAFVLCMAALFLGNALAGLVLLRLAPTHASVGIVLGALALAVGATVLAWRSPRGVPTAGCGACGQPQDPALSFCARCGRAEA